MKKPEKRIVNYEDEPLLADLDLPGLLKERDRCLLKAQEWTAKADIVEKSLLVVLKEVKADTVLYNDSRGEWRTTMVQRDPQTRLDPVKLKDNMMKIGKLDAPTVGKILEKSKVEGKIPDPYVVVSLAEKANA